MISLRKHLYVGIVQLTFLADTSYDYGIFFSRLCLWLYEIHILMDALNE